VPSEPALRARGLVKRFTAPSGPPIEVLAGVDLDAADTPLVQ